jgi:hypothetical protein
MHTLDYTTLVTKGVFGFLLGAVGAGACYFFSSYLARQVVSKPLAIYFVRLAFTLILSVIWLFCCMQMAVPRMGDELRPEFWYRNAWQDGVGYGSLSLCAWIIVALIDRPKQRYDKTHAA